MMAAVEQSRFSSVSDLGGLELLSARFIEHSFDPHVHDSYAIAVLEEGAERYRYRGAEHLAAAGSFALLNPDEVHTGSKAHEQGWWYRGFYPAPAQVHGVLEELGLAGGGMPSFGVSVLQDLDLHQAFGQLHRLLDSDADALQQQTAWREAILLLFQRHARIAQPAEPGREPRAVALAKELLAARLGEPPSLEELATLVNLSPFHFARVFRRATGLPPHAWLKQRRLEQARALLRSGCAPLQVAMQLGFSDQSHLSRQFKQSYGVSPGEYRRACADF
jgi:AraC-like DNA-binding protein